MTDFKALIALLQKSVNQFDRNIPGIQKSMLDSLRAEIQGLEVTRGGVKASAANLRKVAAIKSKLQGIIISKDYVDSIKKYAATFDQVTALQNKYFAATEKKYTPPKLAAQLRKQAKEGVVDLLTERGLAGNVINAVDGILQKSVTTGGSITELQQTLENKLTNNDKGPGLLQQYTKQITTDALNQYSAQYSQLVSSDLGYEWFVYAGSNIETTRPLCLACVKKRYIHISEFPAIISGEFEEFKEFEGKMYKGLPAGMMPETNASNFQIYRGGYNCGHQLRPVNEEQVPIEKRNKVYATQAYKQWVRANGKKPIEPAKTEEKPKETEFKTADIIRQNNAAAIKELEDKGIVMYDDILNYANPQMKIESTDGGSYYQPATRRMVIHTGNRADSEYYQKKIVTHEGAHAMHFHQEIITYDKVSPEFQAHYKNLKSIVKGKEGEIDRLIWKTASEHMDAPDKLEQLGVLHDTLGGLTRGLYGAGHSKKYYKTGNMSEMEVFAHGVTLHKLGSDFADLTPEIQNLVDAMIDYSADLFK